MPTWFSATVSSSARIAGSEPVFAKYARKRGCCQCVTAGRISRVEVVEQRRERLAVLGRRLGQPLEQPARLDLREHRQLADALEVRRRPLERRRAVAPQVDGRRFLIRSICFHVRVFTTSAFVSHARRAWPIAELDVVLRADLVPVGVDDELQPGLARGARVHVAQVEPVRLRVELEERLRLERLLDHALEVDVDRAALVELAAGEVADAVDVRVLHRREDALERVLLAAPRARTRRPSRASRAARRACRACRRP